LGPAAQGHAISGFDRQTRRQTLIQTKARYENSSWIRVPQTLEEVCDPRQVALLVYDMQVGILNQIKNPEQITQQVLKVLSASRDAAVRVFFSRHLSLPKELMGMSQYRMAMAWQHTDSPEQVDPWFLRDTPGFHIAPELNPASE
jgi:biuret amidohydrolase